MALIVAVIK